MGRAEDCHRVGRKINLTKENTDALRLRTPDSNSTKNPNMKIGTSKTGTLTTKTPKARANNLSWKILTIKVPKTTTYEASLFIHCPSKKLPLRTTIV